MIDHLFTYDDRYVEHSYSLNESQTHIEYYSCFLKKPIADFKRGDSIPLIELYLEEATLKLYKSIDDISTDSFVSVPIKLMIGKSNVD